MAMVEIPDDVYESLRTEGSRRLLTDDPSVLLVQLVRGYLADVCAPGFDKDGLTGSLTRQRLRIEMHLDAGVLASKPAGTRIECGDPIWLDRL